MSDKCKRCGACKECGAVQSIPYPVYPVYPYPSYPNYVPSWRPGYQWTTSGGISGTTNPPQNLC